jgi:hypothetical protein
MTGIGLIGISVRADLRLLQVKRSESAGRYHNPECEACQ